MFPILAAVLVTVAGLPLAFALTRSVPLALVLAPLVTALICTTATVLMMFVGGKLAPWLAVAVVAQIPLVILLLRRGGRMPHGSWTDVLWLVAPLLPPFLMVLSPPVDWDTHSIWWTQAAYFSHDATLARHTMTNPVCLSCDYPPLAAAPVAAAWNVLGDYNFRIAHVANSLTTFSAIAMLGYAMRTVTHRAPAIASRLAAAGVSLAVWATAPWVVTAGYSDALWSASFVAAALLLLYVKDQLNRPALPLLLLTVAALCKNEGFATVVVLAALLTLRERRNLRLAWRLWVPVAAGATWVLYTRMMGLIGPIMPERFPRFFKGDPAMLKRIPPTLAAMWQLVGVLSAIALAVALLGALFLRHRRRELGISSDLWMWLVNGAYAAILVVVYAVDADDLEWFLPTNIDRVTIPLALLSCASAACWGVVAMTAVVPVDRASRGTDREEPAAGRRAPGLDRQLPLPAP